MSVDTLFLNNTATTQIYTLSLHDALPISPSFQVRRGNHLTCAAAGRPRPEWRDRKSTRLNSSHLGSSYAVFCLKKKKATSKSRRNTASNSNTHNKPPSRR